MDPADQNGKADFDVAVIGAGVVGAALAQAFTLAGARVVVLEKAVDVLEKHLSKRPADWEGIRVMALIRLRMGNLEGALQYVQLLPTVAPWRAESFDWLSYVAERVNRPDVVQQAKLRGDEVFGEEGRMFEELRAYLDA